MGAKKKLKATGHIGKCTLCGAKTVAHDPYWLRRCPAC